MAEITLEADDVLEPVRAADNGWRKDKAGKEYIPRQGKSGIIHRQGEETPQEARERDAKPRDKRPRKPKRPKMAPAPAKIDLKELENVLAEVFKAPAIPCGAFGDVWAAEHFTRWGPNLARNLVIASEHNPWLRKKLEDAMTGQDAAMQVMVLLPVASGAIAYLLPPLVWWLNLPVSPRVKVLFDIPERKPQDAPAPTPAPAPESGPIPFPAPAA